MTEIVAIHRVPKQEFDLKVIYREGEMPDITSEVISFAEAVYDRKVYVIKGVKENDDISIKEKITALPRKNKKIENDLSFKLKAREFYLYVDKRYPNIVLTFKNIFSQEKIDVDIEERKHDIEFNISIPEYYQAVSFIQQQIDPVLMALGNMNKAVRGLLFTEKYRSPFIPYYDSIYLHAIPYVSDLFFKISEKIGAQEQRHSFNIYWFKKAKSNLFHIGMVNLNFELDRSLF